MYGTPKINILLCEKKIAHSRFLCIKYAIYFDTGYTKAKQISNFVNLQRSNIDH